MDKIISGVLLTPLKKIFHPKGDIFHAMKKSDEGFEAFGEAYFSCISKNEIKGWKKHTKMVLNFVVPVGEIEFVLFDDRENSSTKGEFFSVKLSLENYQRLTIPQNIWVAFKGLSDNTSLLLNLASLEHDPKEAVNKEIDEISYNWN